MKVSHVVLASMALALTMSPALAETNAEAVVDRDVRQQERIEQGLKAGTLTTGEAARLEKGEAAIDRAEAKDLKDGTMTNAERAKIERMEADVAHDVKQEKRIDQGMKSGSLTNKETARLERGEAQIDRKEFQAGKDGNIGKGEQRRIQRAENRESRRIYKEKHDAAVKPVTKETGETDTTTTAH